MIKSNIKKIFHCNLDKIWDIVTDNKNYLWRSDLSKIEIVDDKNFIEYSKSDYKTYFTITYKKELEEYHFDFKNTNITGKWIGKFKKISNDTTELDFTEEVLVNNLVMKLLAKF